MSPLVPRRRAAGAGAAPAKRPPANPITVGAIGIVVVLAFVYLSFAKRVPFVHGYRIQGVFASSNQLRKGNPVRIAGVDVGKVIGFSDGPGTTRVVKLELRDTAKPLHQDATLRIRPRIFLEGGFYVELQPGSPSAPELDSGGTIPLSQTSIPVQIAQILTAFNRPVRDSLRQMLSGLSASLDKGGLEGFRRALRPLAPALKDLAIINHAARGTEPHDLGDLVRGLSRVTGGLARNDQALRGLVTSLNRTTRALASESTPLRASLRELDGVLRDAPPALTALDGALPPTRELAAALRPALPLQAPVLRRTADVLRQLRGLVGPKELPLLVRRLRPALVSLPQLERRQLELFPLVTPVSDCLRDRTLPVLFSKLDDGRLSTGRPVWQDFAHATVGLSSASQNFDGNGPSIRLLAGTGDQGLILGPVPGVGSLVGRGMPLEGTRPRWLGPGVALPFRPDADCRDQAPPNLQARGDGALSAARSVPARAPASQPKMTRAQLRRLLEKLQAPRSGRR